MAYTSIDDPSAYFHTQIYTGNATDSTSITNDANAGNFQPDWLWIKNRSSAGGVGPHFIVDSSRGANKDFHMNNDEAEHTTTNAVKSFNSDGFTIDDGGTVNNNTDNYVAWQWKANGGTTASNTDGNLTTTVQVNQTAGFSIILWTSTGTSDTIGHGLGATPQIIIEKSRENSGDWMTFNSMGGNRLLFLNTNAGETTSFSGVSSVGASVFTDGNGGTDTRVAWCFTPIQGYSKFGTYTGNGSTTDGVFVYTGFSPAWVLMKRTSGSEAWMLVDSKRPGFNVIDDVLEPNDSAAEGASTDIDLLSNGFKLRKDNSNVNGETYIYIAFAEHPFVSSKGVPTTAR